MHHGTFGSLSGHWCLQHLLFSCGNQKCLQIIEHFMEEESSCIMVFIELEFQKQLVQGVGWEGRRCPRAGAVRGKGAGLLSMSFSLISMS